MAGKGKDEDVKLVVSALVDGLENVAKLTGELKELEKSGKEKIPDNTKNLRDGADKTTGIIGRLLQRLTGLGSTTKESSTGTKQLANEIDRSSRAANSADGSIGRFTSRLKTLAATYLSIQGLKTALTSIFSTGDKFERLEKQLTGVMGSLERGQAATAWLKEFAKGTPQQLDDLTDGFVKLKSFGLDPMNGSYQAIVDQAAKLGGSQETLNGIILGVGQAWAKQKLQGEEILQLVERGVPVWDLLAKATGKSTAELQKLSQAGKLGREEIALLVAEMGKASAGSAADQVGALSGLISNLKDRWAEFLDLISKSGAMDWLKQQLQDISTTVDQMARDGRLKKWAQDISDAIVSVGKTLRAGVSYLVEYKNQLLFLGKTFAAFKVVQAVQGLASFTKGLVASRAAMIAAAAQANASGSVIGRFGASLAALARPIPITLMLLGVQAVMSGLTWVARKMSGVEEAEKALAEQAERHRKERELAAEAARKEAEAYEQYKDTVLRGAAEIDRMNQEEMAAYAEKLKSAKNYYQLHLEALEKEKEAGAENIAQYEEARQKLEEINQTLRTVEREASRAGESLRLGIQEATLDVLTEFAKLRGQGVETADAIQQSLSTIDIKTPQGINQLAEVMAKLVVTAQANGEEIGQALSEPLSKLSTQELQQFQEAFTTAMGKAGAGSERAAAVLQQVFKAAAGKIKVDLDAVATGIDQATRTAIGSLELMAKNIEKMPYTAEQSAAMLKSAFDAALSSVSNSKELDFLKARVEDIFRGPENADVLANMLDLIRQKAEALNKTTMNDGAEDLAKSLLRAGQIMDDINNKEPPGEKGFRYSATAADALKSQVEAVRAALGDLSSQALAAFDQGFLGRGALNEMDEARAKLADMAQKLSDLQQYSYRLNAGGIGDWMNDMQKAAAEASLAFYKQKVEFLSLIEAVESGSMSLQRLNDLSRSAKNQFDLLDDTDLSRLNSAIDTARQKIESLNNSAATTLANLRNELDQMEGDLAAVQQRNYEMQRQQLQKQLQDAQEAGAKDAARDAQEALKVAEQVHRRKMQQIKEEEAARRKAAQEEAARAREEAAQRAQQAAASTTTQRTQTTSSRPLQRIVLQAPSGRDVEVQTADPDAFLATLEAAGLRSAL